MNTPEDTHAAYAALLSLCQARYSVREFESDPVSQADIERILAVAKTAPYASGKKSWEIVVITDSAVRQQMVEAVRLKSAQIAADIPEELRLDYTNYAENFHAFESAPAILVPTFRVSPSLSLMCHTADQLIQQWEHDNYVKSIACVSMLTLLAAQSLGLSGCMMTGPLLAADTLSTIIGAKRGRSLAAIIPIGYPKKESHSGY